MTKETEKKHGFELVCKRCGYKWMYGGSSDWYASCPRCRGTVSVRNRKRELGMKVE